MLSLIDQNDPQLHPQIHEQAFQFFETDDLLARSSHQMLQKMGS
uniref:Uncharacterized protein n=1 Tax=Arundo donax TaxID=35708 RepID=A0A0A9FZ63_ARUDO